MPQPNQYLESKVLTASQPQLHRMMLEGALRFGRQARQLWGDREQAAEVERLLGRTIDLVEELSRSVTEGDSDVSEQLEELYAFIYRELVSCRYNLSSDPKDAGQLDEVLKLLDYQRETWKQACNLCESDETDSANAAKGASDVADGTRSVPATSDLPLPMTMPDEISSGGLTLEA